MNTNDFAPLILFITGPTYLRDETRQAGLLPEFGHRDSENDKRFKPIRQWLNELAGSGDEYEPVIYNGSGSTAMESSIRSLVADGETVLNVSVGAFGDLYHKMAVLNGKKAAQLKFAPGQAIDLGRLEAELKLVKPAVVTYTHNETSTGVTNDIHAISEMVRAHGALPLVDGVSLFGGAAVDLKGSGIAMYSTSTQKSLALPAGFGIAFIHRDAEEKAQRVTNRGHSSCIINQLGRARKNQTLTTPNGTLANQMFVELDYIVNQEGIGKRFARHLAMRDMVAKWVETVPGYELFAPAGHRSPTLTAVQVPSGVTIKQLKALKEAMRGHGYLFDPGYGKLNTAL
ncbi:MAG: alanine--glyoxylate aminotransferase family protein, partial [Desulfovibrionaceae bacterium]